MRHRRLMMLLGVGAAVTLGPVTYAAAARAATGPVHGTGHRTAMSAWPGRADPDPASGGSTSVSFRVLPPDPPPPDPAPADPDAGAVGGGPIPGGPGTGAVAASDDDTSVDLGEKESGGHLTRHGENGSYGGRHESHGGLRPSRVRPGTESAGPRRRPAAHHGLLPFTGADIGAATRFGVAAVLAGVLALASVRRRRQAPGVTRRRRRAPRCG
ncbi:hypothetical protein [Actinoallomurus sp. CA-142502]|uniref:hypothetical protein n=1 Tax=Actinoallomurus sp. CA-142502 TaxID=3239885 RepID=UPI003D9321AD